MDSITIALYAMLVGPMIGGAFVWGYYAGRKDQTPGDRK
jgi:hypothetical protein